MHLVSFYSDLKISKSAENESLCRGAVPGAGLSVGNMWVLSHAVNRICPLYVTIIYSKNVTCKMWYLYSRMQFEVVYFMDIVLFVL